MRKEEYDYSVLLDTSFLLRLLSRDDPFFDNADGFFRAFLQHGIPMYVSTVAIGEFCVENNWKEFPSKYIRILPYNFFHALTAGRFAKILYDARKEGELKVSPRNIIPNDVKQLAQAQIESNIKYFVTSDTESWKKFSQKIEEKEVLTFSHLDIRNCSYLNFFGDLGLNVE